MLAQLAAQAAQVIAPIVEKDSTAIAEAFIVPTKANAGDLALPCFPFAKAVGQPPPQLAQTLADALSSVSG